MTRPVTIRPAVAGDLEGILAIADDRRRQYATYQPRFWRPAAHAIALQRPHLAGLINDTATITLVATMDDVLAGFAIGTIVTAPAVYDPGGPTCLVDDFTVADPKTWPTLGVDLLRAVRTAARHQHAAQIVVVTGHLDSAKRAALDASGLGIASEWWVGPVNTHPQ